MRKTASLYETWQWNWILMTDERISNLSHLEWFGSWYILRYWPLNVIADFIGIELVLSKLLWNKIETIFLSFTIALYMPGKVKVLTKSSIFVYFFFYLLNIFLNTVLTLMTTYQEGQQLYIIGEVLGQRGWNIDSKMSASCAI